MVQPGDNEQGWGKLEAVLWEDGIPIDGHPEDRVTDKGNLQQVILLPRHEDCYWWCRQGITVSILG